MKPVPGDPDAKRRSVAIVREPYPGLSPTVKQKSVDDAMRRLLDRSSDHHAVTVGRCACRGTAPATGLGLLQPDPRRRRRHARRPRAADRPGPLDGRPARGRAARARPGLRGRRQRVHRRAAADRAGVQPRRRASCSSPTSAPPTRAWRSPTSPATPLAETRRDLDIALGPDGGARLRVTSASSELLDETGHAPRRRARHRHRRPRPGRVRHRAAGEPADHARLGRLLDPGLVRATATTRPVLVDNDVNIMALGEHWAHWRDVEHLLYVKVGTGIGCGIVADGRIHRGAQGAAGDIGHIRVTGHDDVVCRCGNIGCLEAVAGGRALADRLAAAGIDAAEQPRRRRAGARGRRRRDPDGPRRGPHARRGARRRASTSSTRR